MTRLGTDPIVVELERLGRPLTKENWLGLAFSGPVPDNWEQLVDLPEELQNLRPGEAYRGETTSTSTEAQQPTR